MFKKLLKAGVGEAEHVSWMKVGSLVVGVVGLVVTTGICPPAALPVAKGILSIGAAVGLIGARDAIGNN